MKIMNKPKVLLSLTVLFAGIAWWLFSTKQTPTVMEEKKADPPYTSASDSSKNKEDILSTNQVLNGPSHDTKPEIDAESTSLPPAKHSFTDENYESWMTLGAEFYSQKNRNPEQYKEGISFLLNTLRYGNVDKMLSQAAGALFNIHDPELVPTYESILLEPDPNISSEGILRILGLYIHKAPSTEADSFQKVINKYRDHPSVPVKQLAEKWQDFRK